MKFFSTRFLRFLVVGAANTAISFGLYLAANIVLDYRWAYSVSYVLSIGISYVLNSRFVFREPLSLAKFAAFPLVYIAQFTMGLLLVWLLVDRAGVHEAAAPLLTVLATVPVTYVLTRFILTPRRRHAS